MATLNLNTDAVPDEIISKLKSFLIDKRTGNLTLNIKDGRILGFRAEEVVSLKASE